MFLGIGMGWDVQAGSGICVHQGLSVTCRVVGDRCVIYAGANACHCVGVCLLFLGLAFVGLVARVPGYVDFDVLGLYEG